MKIVIRAIIVVVVLVALVIIALPFLFDANQFRPRVESELTRALGRETKVGNLKLNLFSQSIVADQLSVADDPAFSPNPFLHARSLKLTVELWPLITSRKVDVVGLLIDTPEIALIQSDSGKWNFSGIGAKRSAAAVPPPPSGPSEDRGLDLSAKLVKISDGHLSIGHTGTSSKPVVIGNVAIEVQNFSPASVFPFSLSAKIAPGGDLKLEGKAGPINSADSAATPVQANLQLSNVQLAASNLVDAASGIDGLITIAGNGSSNGQIANWKGNVKADKLKLARGGSPARRPVEFDFALAEDLKIHTGTLNSGAIRIGKASANLTGSWVEHAQSNLLNLHLNGPSMPVPELVEMLPALDIALPAGSSLQGGTLTVNVTSTGPMTGLVTTGSVALNNTKLAGFDLGSRLSAIQKLAGAKSGPTTEIQTFSANIRSAPEGTAVDHLALIVPSIGQFSGGGTISASKALDFKMLAQLRPSSGVIASASALAGIGQRQATIPFFIQGTASNPQFKPDVAGIAAAEINRFDKNGAGKAATGILGGFLGGKKKR
jgi:AsmA protein